MRALPAIDGRFHGAGTASRVCLFPERRNNDDGAIVESHCLRFLARLSENLVRSLVTVGVDEILFSVPLGAVRAAGKSHQRFLFSVAVEVRMFDVEEPAPFSARALFLTVAENQRLGSFRVNKVAEIDRSNAGRIRKCPGTSIRLGASRFARESSGRGIPISDINTRSRLSRYNRDSDQ